MALFSSCRACKYAPCFCLNLAIFYAFFFCRASNGSLYPSITELSSMEILVTILLWSKEISLRSHDGHQMFLSDYPRSDLWVTFFQCFWAPSSMTGKGTWKGTLMLNSVSVLDEYGEWRVTYMHIRHLSSYREWRRPRW